MLVHLSTHIYAYKNVLAVGISQNIWHTTDLARDKASCRLPRRAPVRILLLFFSRSTSKFYVFSFVGLLEEQIKYLLYFSDLWCKITKPWSRKNKGISLHCNRRNRSTGRKRCSPLHHHTFKNINKVIQRTNVIWVNLMFIWWCIWISMLNWGTLSFSAKCMYVYSKQMGGSVSAE